jgi:hypothetical protein
MNYNPHAAQDAAVARANPAPNATPYPGGVADRAAAEFAVAEVVAARHDGLTVHRDEVVGHWMAGSAYAVIAELEFSAKLGGVAE